MPWDRQDAAGRRPGVHYEMFTISILAIASVALFRHGSANCFGPCSRCPLVLLNGPNLQDVLDSDMAEVRTQMRGIDIKIERLAAEITTIKAHSNPRMISQRTIVISIS